MSLRSEPLAESKRCKYACSRLPNGIRPRILCCEKRSPSFPGSRLSNSPRISFITLKAGLSASPTKFFSMNFPVSRALSPISLRPNRKALSMRDRKSPEVTSIWSRSAMKRSAWAWAADRVSSFIGIIAAAASGSLTGFKGSGMVRLSGASGVARTSGCAGDCWGFGVMLHSLSGKCCIDMADELFKNVVAGWIDDVHHCVRDCEFSCFYRGKKFGAVLGAKTVPLSDRCDFRIGSHHLGEARAVVGQRDDRVLRENGGYRVEQHHV